jgi:hypothetical protein
MKVTATMHAFLPSESSATPQELQTPKGVRRMSFFSDKDYWLRLGYTYIGEATIAVDVPDEKALIDSKVEALREEIKTTRAEATAKCTQLEGQIQQLLAIEFTPSAPAAD